jgi:8-oxo-dGTP diphosphatase
MEQVIAVAGVLIKDNHVLMATRPEGKSHAGSWEFPGGKIETGETLNEALVRELAEEIGVVAKVEDCKDLTYIVQNYGNKQVKLHVMLVKRWVGEPSGNEGQKLYWQDLNTKCELQPLLLTTQRILDLLII